jgi:uncharacterized protein (DUF2126 family)
VFSNAVLLDVTVALGISAGILIGVAITEHRRTKARRGELPEHAAVTPEDARPPSDISSSANRGKLISRLLATLTRIAHWLRDFGPIVSRWRGARLCLFSR